MKKVISKVVTLPLKKPTKQLFYDPILSMWEEIGFDPQFTYI